MNIVVKKQDEVVVGKSKREILERLRNRSRDVTSLTAQEDVILCVDTSGSMAGEKIKALKEAILEFVLAKQRIGVDDRVALVMFGEITQQLTELTNNQNLIKEKVQKLEAGGGTPMGHGLFLCREILERSRKAERRLRIILLSDGRATDVHSVHAPLQETGLLKELGVIIDTICIGENNDLDEELLKQIAKLTGGKYLHVKDISQLPKKYAELAEKKMIPFNPRLSLK